MYLPSPALMTVANSHLLSHLDYCSPLLHNLKASQLDRLLKLKKYCARVIMNINRSTKSKPLFIQLQWLPLHQRTKYSTSCMMFKIIKEDAPSYLTEVFQSISSVHNLDSLAMGTYLLTEARKAIF